LAVWSIANGLNCQKCNSQLKKVRGCEGLPEINGKTQTIEIKELGIIIDKCPYRYITSQSILYLEAYHYYKNGYLPYPGGWLKQPLKLFEAFRVIDSEIEKLGER